MSQVIRPEATGKKINCREEFELCYIRHQYFRKVDFNPTEADMKPYHAIIKNFAKRTFFTHQGLFQQVGLEIDDIISIGKVHLVSYLGLFSVSSVPEKFDRFIDTFIDRNGHGPETPDILNKDRANFTMFLKQRMEDLVRITRQKIRNIKGLLADEYLVFYGPNKPPEARHELPKHYRSLGFKKLDVAIFKSLKRKIKDQEGPVFKINGLYYVTVPVAHRNLTIYDLQGAGLDPYESIHNMNPEEIMVQIDTERQYQRWYAAPQEERNKKIREFISANKDNPLYTEEVKTARKLINNE